VSRIGFRGCGKTQNSVILSEAKNLSLLPFLYLNRREILRFAQNDKTRPFFRRLFRLSVFSWRRAKSKSDMLKPVLLGSRTTSCLVLCRPPSDLVLALALSAIATFSPQNANAQQLPQATPNPETALTDALSAACRQDSPAFSNSLTADNAAAFRELPGPQRTAMMKRFVLLEEPGRPLLSTSSDGHRIVRCESPGFTVELRLSETRVRGNLAFVPMEIPISGEDPHKITFGLVREGGGWKMLSVGLILLDVPTLAKQWEQADLDANEGVAIADLRSVAEAVKTYRNAYRILPETLAALGPAPPGGASPDAAGLLDTGLAAGEKNGYTLRYTIVPATDFVPGEDSGKAVNFSIASSPKEYGKSGRRSFFLDSSGILRGADKKGAVATTTDPRVEAGPS
jgi:hypothetical protein